jgi:diguanylate cyclase (GGDEF)-like protein
MTLDPSTTDLIARLLEGKLRAQQPELDRALDAIKVSAVRRGVLRSGMTEQAMKGAYRTELNNRTKIALATVQEVFAKRGIQDREGLAEDVRGWLYEFIDRQTVELAMRLSNELSNLSLGGGDLAVQEERDHLRREMTAQIELYVSSLSPPKPATGASGPVVSGERDHLTQLMGRAAFDSALNELCRKATAEQPVSLVLADIDRFKAVNDNHGHPVGDGVLREAARRFERVIHAKGLAFRYGGEEYAAILSNHTPEEALAVAERARLAVEEATINGLAITCSFGVATVPVHAASPEQLLEKADRALYDSKDLGRNLVRLFGEPKPEQPRSNSSSRKPAPPSGLSDDAKEEMRMQIVRNGVASCPLDGVDLDVVDASAMGDLGRSFLVHCPGCGFRSDRPAKKRAV